MSVRVLLVVYGLALGTLILTLAIIFVRSQGQDARDREKLKNDVIAAIEADNAARVLADAKQAEGTRRIVCSLVEHDLPRSANTIALARQLKCGQPILPTPQPQPQQQVQPQPGTASQQPPVVIVTVQPAPQASPQRQSSPPASPKPSPSPTCTVEVRNRCVVVFKQR